LIVACAQREGFRITPELAADGLFQYTFPARDGAQAALDRCKQRPRFLGSHAPGVIRPAQSRQSERQAVAPSVYVGTLRETIGMSKTIRRGIVVVALAATALLVGMVFIPRIGNVFGRADGIHDAAALPGHINICGRS
jgi:hypothetical protein